MSNFFDEYADRIEERDAAIRNYFVVKPEGNLSLHYKGGLYEWLGSGIHTETREELDFYRHVWPNAPGYYARPIDMWDEQVLPGIPRFSSLFSPLG